MDKIIRVGTRPSRLALKQVEEIQRYLPDFKLEVVIILTQGDRDKITPLSQVEGSDFFTREIDQALLSGEIDMAVHSGKDLPEFLPSGLSVALETKSVSPYDVLASRDNLKLKELPAGSRIGVSSQRRKNEMRSLRADLEIVDIRGTIEERLALLDTGRIGALIVAHAALIRLGLEERIAEIFPLNLFNTHPRQGSLALVVKEEACEKVRYILSELARATGN